MIMGDFNFHVEDTNDLVALRFMNLCKSKGLKQHVRGPTQYRFTGYSELGNRSRHRNCF